MARRPRYSGWQAQAYHAAVAEGFPDPDAFVRQMGQEAHGADLTSPAGAQGPAQFMPGTARSVGLSPTQVHQRGPAYRAAAKLMTGYAHQFGSVKDALIAYNAGPGAVGKPLPAETANYLQVIHPGHFGSSSPTAGTGPASTPGMKLPGTSVNLGSTLNQAAYQQADRRSILANFLLNQNPGLQSSPLFSLGVLNPASPNPADYRTPAGSVKIPGVQLPGTTATASSAPGGMAKHFKPGDPVAHGTGIGGLHPTEGLNGYPAHDYFAPAGSPVVAPITGKIVKLSGHDPAQGPVQGPHGPLGWSAYIRGSDGRTYYLTHMGSRNLKVGQRVRAGQRIGTVANYAQYGTPSHIHMGVSG